MIHGPWEAQQEQGIIVPKTHGLMDPSEDWFTTILMPYFKWLPEKVLIGDNLPSHISFKIFQECEQNNI